MAVEVSGYAKFSTDNNYKNWVKHKKTVTVKDTRMYTKVDNSSGEFILEKKNIIAKDKNCEVFPTTHEYGRGMMVEKHRLANKCL